MAIFYRKNYGPTLQLAPLLKRIVQRAQFVVHVGTNGRPLVPGGVELGVELEAGFRRALQGAHHLFGQTHGRIDRFRTTLQLVFQLLGICFFGYKFLDIEQKIAHLSQIIQR